MSETPGNEPLHSEDLLLTRLIPPHMHASLILRPSLFARLDKSFEKRVTLVSAPTGFGKTTLVSQWLSQRQPDHPFLSAWVTLDEEDNDPLRFWRYVLQAIRQSDETIGKSALAVLRVARQPNYPGLLTGLVNELAQLPRRS